MLGHYMILVAPTKKRRNIPRCRMVSWPHLQQVMTVASLPAGLSPAVAGAGSGELVISIATSIVRDIITVLNISSWVRSYKKGTCWVWVSKILQNVLAQLSELERQFFVRRVNRALYIARPNHWSCYIVPRFIGPVSCSTLFIDVTFIFNAPRGTLHPSCWPCSLISSFSYFWRYRIFSKFVYYLREFCLLTVWRHWLIWVS